MKIVDRKRHFAISTDDFFATVWFRSSTSINEQNEIDNEKGIRVYRSVRHTDASDQDQRTTLPQGLRKRLERSYLTEWCTSTYRARADCENKHSLL